MVSFADYALETTGHHGKTLKDFPQMADQLEQGAGDASDSPVLSRAPLVLQQSLLFPYQNGLTFEQVVLTKDGVEKAFAGVLQSPPSSSYEIMTPEAYRRHLPVPLMRLPDIHPMLKDAGYEPYDVGVMGELDVRMTAELFWRASPGGGAGPGVGWRRVLCSATQQSDSGGEEHDCVDCDSVQLAVEERGLSAQFFRCVRPGASAAV